MSYQGDYAEDATVDFKFHTNGTDGTPTTLSGTPALSVYKANGTTQSTAGITLSADFDSVTGCNHVRIDTSADAFYATGNDYDVIITTGTVGGTSVVGYRVGSFSVQNRFMRGTDSAYTGTPPTAAAIRAEMDSNSTKLASIEADTNELQTDNIPGTLTTIEGKIDTVDTVADRIEVDTQDIQSRLPAALSSGRMAADTQAISGSTDAADRLEESAKQILIATVDAGTFTPTTTAFEIDDINGSAPSSTNDFYNGRVVIFTSGTLANQATEISDYDGTNKRLTVVALTSEPADNDTFIIV